MEKDREVRYQHASEIRADLKRLRRDTEPGRAEAAISDRRAAVGTLPVQQRRWLVAIGIIVIALGVAGWYGYRRSRATPEPPLTAVPLTSYLGSESYPSFSPDGSQVAFTLNGEKQDNWDIYVKVVGSEPPLRLTTNPAEDTSPAWSPDGRWIAFDRLLPGGKVAVVLISPLGGPERILTEMYFNEGTGARGPFLAWSPDSRWLAMVGNDTPDEGFFRLFLYSVETGENRRLTSHSAASLLGDSCPAFSPDGRTLAFFRWASWFNSDLYLLDLAQDFNPVGEPKRLTFGNWRAASPAWTADGRSLIFSAALDNLWRVDASGEGKPQRLAAFGANGIDPAISRRGNRLAFAQQQQHGSIWRIEIPTPGGKANLPQKFIPSRGWDAHPKFSPDGKRIAFLSGRSGSNEIWVCDADGSNPVQLTFIGGSFVAGPLDWSPDSRRVTFPASQEGLAAVYVIDASGGSPQRITANHVYSSNPSWSKDGRWILFDSNSPKSGFYKVPAEGGPAVLVLNPKGWAPKESPDGKFIYYAGFADGSPLLRTPVKGGEAEQVLDSLYWGHSYALVEDGIYFVPREDPKSGYSIQFLNTRAFP